MRNASRPPHCLKHPLAAPSPFALPCPVHAMMKLHVQRSVPSILQGASAGGVWTWAPFPLLRNYRTNSRPILPPCQSNNGGHGVYSMGLSRAFDLCCVSQKVRRGFSTLCTTDAAPTEGRREMTNSSRRANGGAGKKKSSESPVANSTASSASAPLGIVPLSPSARHQGAEGQLSQCALQPSSWAPPCWRPQGTPQHQIRVVFLLLGRR